MRVTQEQSKKVQKIVFSNGGEWASTGKSLFDQDYDYIYISVYKKLFDEEMDDFLCKEVDADLFIRTNGTCEEEPQYLRVAHKDGETTMQQLDNEIGTEPHTQKPTPVRNPESGKQYYVLNLCGDHVPMRYLSSVGDDRELFKKCLLFESVEDADSARDYVIGKLMEASR